MGATSAAPLPGHLPCSGHRPAAAVCFFSYRRSPLLQTELGKECVACDSAAHAL